MSVAVLPQTEGSEGSPTRADPQHGLCETDPALALEELDPEEKAKGNKCSLQSQSEVWSKSAGWGWGRQALSRGSLLFSSKAKALGGCSVNRSDKCPSQEDLFLCPEMDTFH